MGVLDNLLNYSILRAVRGPLKGLQRQARKGEINHRGKYQISEEAEPSKYRPKGPE
jgi:hypothetical protein